MTPIAHALKHLHLGSTRTAGRLSVFPLIAPAENEPSYLLLDEALASGWVSITEISASGSVPELKFENRASRPVLVVDGESLVGAKQNRIANITILVPAQTLTTIPVSCVERGRWAYRRPDFASADHVLYSQTRARKARDVTASLTTVGQPRADQAAIWHEISCKAMRMSAQSPSDSMDVIFENRRPALEGLQAQLAPVENETGAVFALGGHIAGVEIFDSSRTWGRFAPKVIRSYGLDALDDDLQIHDVFKSSADAWLRDLCSASVAQFPSVGLGHDVRIEHPRLAGGALLVGQAIVHCAAFAVDAWQ